MTVHVLVFGAMASATGAGKVAVDVGEEASVRDVLVAISQQHPSLRFALSAARLAVNSAFAPDAAKVTSKDELALIALVSGG